MSDDNQLAELKRIITDISFYNTTLEFHEKNAQTCRERLANLQQELLGWWSTVATLPSDEIDNLDTTEEHEPNRCPLCNEPLEDCLCDIHGILDEDELL
jgi:hypothetical protein